MNERQIVDLNLPINNKLLVPTRLTKEVKFN